MVEERAHELGRQPPVAQVQHDHVKAHASGFHGRGSELRAHALHIRFAHALHMGLVNHIRLDPLIAVYFREGPLHGAGSDGCCVRPSAIRELAGVKQLRGGLRTVLMNHADLFFEELFLAPPETAGFKIDQRVRVIDTDTSDNHKPRPAACFCRNRLDLIGRGRFDRITCDRRRDDTVLQDGIADADGCEKFFISRVQFHICLPEFCA